MDEALKEKLLGLTWDGLTRWAGSRSASRGEGYVSEVEDMVETPDGAVAARVHGTYDYLTRIRLDADGKLKGDCSCPVGDCCKHAVALVLVAARRLKDGKDIEPCDADSPYYEEIKDELDEMDEDWDSEEDDEPDDFDAEDASPSGGVRTRRSKGDAVDEYLSKLDNKEIRDLLRELVDKAPKVHSYIAEKIKWINATTSGIAKMAKEAIKDASDWNDDYYWDRYEYDDEAPDYGKVVKCFRELKAAGEWKALRDLGFDLLERSQRQIECSNDDGEIYDQVEECLGIVVKAIAKSPLPPIERTKWALELADKDRLSLSYAAMERFFAKEALAKADWSEVADLLESRFRESLCAAKPDSSYELGRACDKVATALENAERMEDVIRLRGDSAEKTRDYEKLVQFLLKMNRQDDAAEWCRKGMRTCGTQWMGISSSLRKILKSISETNGDFPMAAAYDARSFFEEPSLRGYETLHEACDKAGRWETVRKFVLRFLEDGKRPEAAKDWPLPKPDCPALEGRWIRLFPDHSLLTKIALQEKRPADAIRWFKAGKSDTFGDLGWDVARAVKKEFPDEALAIWRRIAAANCAYAEKCAYDAIAKAFAEMRPVMEKQGKGDEWHREVQDVRETYKRRRNLAALLDDLLGKKRPSARVVN